MALVAGLSRKQLTAPDQTLTMPTNSTVDEGVSVDGRQSTVKLSTRARYALRMLLEIAKQPENTTVSLGTVSKNTNISRRYLDQLAIALKSASLVVSSSGRGGGYRLARPSAEINLAEIVEASIGPINIVDCVGNPEVCDKANGCLPREVYALINRRINDAFSELTLAKLADPAILHEVVDGWEKRDQAEQASES